jgi:replication-associated recombination protein RarA
MPDLFNPSSSTPSQNGFQFPQSLTERYRPATIAQFVGLEKPKRLCARLAENPFDSAWLFVGASGTGKTTMALAIASMMPAELHHIPSQECNLESIERIRRTCQYVPRLGCKKHLVLIDEADRMTAAAQLSMLSKLDSTNFPPDTIFILTCNQTDGLEPRFLSRLRTVEFSSYGLASDAAALLESVWKAESAADAKTPNFARIVKESNNNIRESLLKLETELLLS